MLHGYPRSPMGIPSTLLYKHCDLWVSQQPYCTKAVPYGHSSSPTVQGQYLWVSQQPYYISIVPYGFPSSSNVQGQYHMGIPTVKLYKGSTQGQYHISAALLYTDNALWVSQQPYCTKTVSNGYPSSSLVQNHLGIPAALLYKDRTIWLTQQPICTWTETYRYPSSPVVQGQHPTGIVAALLYKGSTQ